MASLNRQELIGRLGKDVEVKSSQNGGKSYCFLSVATDDYAGKDADGKSKTETTWHNVTVFGQQADFLGKAAHKGSEVYISGRTEIKKDNEGVWRCKVIADTVLLLGGKEANGNGNGNGTAASNGNGNAQQSATVDRGAARAAAAQQSAPPPQVTQAASTATAVADDDDSDLPF